MRKKLRPPARNSEKDQPKPFRESSAKIGNQHRVPCRQAQPEHPLPAKLSQEKNMINRAFVRPVEAGWWWVRACLEGRLWGGRGDAAAAE